MLGRVVVGAVISSLETQAMRAVLKQISQLKPGRQEPKKGIFIRLDEGILNSFKEAGPGYQTRIAEVLTRYVEVYRQQKQQQKISQRVKRAQQLFEEFREQCFWHLNPKLKIRAAQIDLVVDGLRMYGGHRGYVLAEQLCQ